MIPAVAQHSSYLKFGSWDTIGTGHPYREVCTVSDWKAHIMVRGDHKYIEIFSLKSVNVSSGLQGTGNQRNVVICWKTKKLHSSTLPQTAISNNSTVGTRFHWYFIWDMWNEIKNKTEQEKTLQWFYLPFSSWHSSFSFFLSLLSDFHLSSCLKPPRL